MQKQTVLILGGSGGMGLTTAKLLLKHDFKVILMGRTESKLIALADELGQDCSYVVGDAADENELKTILSEKAALDHIVVAVSTKANATGIQNTATSEAQKAFVRFWISYQVLHFAPAFLNRNGSVTLISGSSAKTPLKGYGVWGTLHGSLNALVRQAAIDIAPIRVNAISPGGIGLRPDHQLAEHRGEAIDIAKMILAVIDNAAVTSTIIDVDSGERQGTWNG